MFSHSTRVGTDRDGLEAVCLHSASLHVPCPTRSKKLGSGSFGDIYLGTHVTSNDEVAVKMEPVRTQHPQLLYEAKVNVCIFTTPHFGEPQHTQGTLWVAAIVSGGGIVACNVVLK